MKSVFDSQPVNSGKFFFLSLLGYTFWSITWFSAGRHLRTPMWCIEDMRNFILFARLDLATASLFSPDFFHSVLAIPKKNSGSHDRQRKEIPPRANKQQAVVKAGWELLFASFVPRTSVVYGGRALFIIQSLIISFALDRKKLHFC